MYRPSSFIKTLVLACGFLLLTAPAAWAADAQYMVIGPQLRVRIAFADPLGSGGPSATMRQFIQDNLGFLPFVTLVNPASVPGGVSLPAATGNIDFKRFQLAGAHMLVTTAWTPEGAKGRVELRLFDVTTGKFLFGNAYSDVAENNAGDVADKFCSDLMQAITGRGEFFRSTLAFVKSNGPNKKDIWAVRPTGRNLRRLSTLSSGNALSPSWSPDGRFVVFSHVDRRTHALGVWDSSTLATQRIKFPGNTVIGPCFMPNNQVAVSLSDGRNPSIFLLDHQFRRLRALDASASIDVSPSVDATGTKMAFVSSRMGNPHIFLKDLTSGAVTRITYEGKYNTEPSISPDGTLITFSRQMSGGHRVFVYDLVKKTETQISFGPGSDEQPAFAPDNYFIAFTSTRNGQRQLYLTTRNGGEPKRIPTGPGDASFADWGLFPR